jgi:hypothetical protein
MSKVFGTIAAVLLAASAFIAMKNQDAYKAEIKAYSGDEGSGGAVGGAKAVKVSTEKELSKQQKRRTGAVEKQGGYLAEATKAQEDLDAATILYDKAGQEVESLKKEHKNNGVEIANANEEFKGLPDHKELVPKIKRMRAELSQATSEITKQEARLANLTQQNAATKVKIDGIRELVNLQNSGESFPTLKTRISAIYRNWGFVIITAGDKQGVVTDSVLDVMRGGEVIGKLKVTAVEEGRASADIVLDSVAVGTTLQSGDTVVAERKAEKPVAVAAP